MDDKHWDFGPVLAGEEFLLDLKLAGIKSGHFNLAEYLREQRFRDQSTGFTTFSKLSGFATIQLSLKKK